MRVRMSPASRRRILIGIAAFIVLIGIALSVRLFGDRQATFAAKFEAGSPSSILENIRQARTIKAQRMNRVRFTTPEAPRLEYEPVAEAFDIDAETREELKSLLTTPSSYNLDAGAKACIMNFGMRLIVDSEGAPLEIWICLSCSHLLIYRGDSLLVSADVGPSEEQWAEMARRLFPNDAASIE